MSILVRCRYYSNVAGLIRAGADIAISEEQETSVTVMRVCEQILWRKEPEKDPPETSG
jgi:hypothetical protein